MIDRRKCGREYELCSRCKYEEDIGAFYFDKCQYCTRIVDVGYGFLMCGIPVGSGITYLHTNFEPKERDKNNNDLKRISE